MIISHLQVSNFRNLSQVKIDLDSFCNLIIGPNGSGKTSLLEAIYYLGRGKSFRSHLLRRIIQYDQRELSIFSQLSKSNSQKISLGISKNTNKNVKIQLSGQALKSFSPIVDMLPLQVINTESYYLLTSGPEQRRQFLDWGVFHVEHSFLSVWRRYRKALQQRNAALRLANYSQIQSWNIELAKAGEIIDIMRQQYLQKLLPLFKQMSARMIDLENLNLEYYRGWDNERELLSMLESVTNSDVEHGYTRYGIHRADIKLTINGVPVKDSLSRGQQKLLVVTLRLVQGQLLQVEQGKQCIYLIDDLAAELDDSRMALIIKILTDLNSQVFISGISEKDFSGFKDIAAKKFHVKHGEIKVSA